MATWGYWAVFFLTGALGLLVAKRLDDLDRKRDLARASGRGEPERGEPERSEPPPHGAERGERETEQT